jgi:hypothetical protein
LCHEILRCFACHPGAGRKKQPRLSPGLGSPSAVVLSHPVDRRVSFM